MGMRWAQGGCPSGGSRCHFEGKSMVFLNPRRKRGRLRRMISDILYQAFVIPAETEFDLMGAGELFS